MDAAYLAIVEGAVYGEVVHVGVHDGRHLRFLYRADFAVWVHDEHGDILLASQAVDGCGASVAARRTDDGQVFPIPPALALVLAHEEVLEEVSEKL